MRETVAINGLTLCHKHSDGFTRSTLMDICRSPQAPVPYTNTALARDLADGTTTVFSHDGAMNGVKGSKFAISFGDDPGVGRGVKSNTVKAEATWLSWSPNVFMEGRAVTRLTDKMLMNHGNTISAGGYYTGPVQGPQREVLEKTCEFACECQAAGTLKQSCIDEKMKQWADKNGRNVTPNGAYEKGSDGKWRPRIVDGGQSKGGPKGTRRPDYTDHDNNCFGECKLPKDRYRGSQDQDYDQIEQDTDQDRHDINFKNDCDCDAGKKQPAPEPAPKTAPAEEKSWLERNQSWLLPVGVGALVVGAILLAPETGGGSLGALAAL